MNKYVLCFTFSRATVIYKNKPYATITNKNNIDINRIHMESEQLKISRRICTIYQFITPLSLSNKNKNKKARMYVCATSVIIGGKSPHFPKLTETCVMCMMTPVTAMPASHRTGTRASRGRWPPGGASAPGSEHREPRPSQCHRASLGCAAAR